MTPYLDPTYIQFELFQISVKPTLAPPSPASSTMLEVWQIIVLGVVLGVVVLGGCLVGVGWVCRRHRHRHHQSQQKRKQGFF